jgi:hypothetical protein
MRRFAAHVLYFENVGRVVGLGVGSDSGIGVFIACASDALM